MPRLHIPLSTSKTARRHRRAVWLWLAIFAAYSLLISTLASLWLTRDTLSSYAPDGTAAVVHLILTQNTYERLIRDFGQVTLVSGRHLTLQDLKNFNCKEAAVFLLEDGTMAVAVRISEANLPRALFDAYGITSQPLNSRAFLLSHTILPIPKKGKTFWNFRPPLSSQIADIRIKTEADWENTALLKTSYGYSIKLKHSGLIASGIPNDERVIASGMLTPGSTEELNRLWIVLDRLLAPIGLLSTDQIAQKISNFGASFVFRTADTSTDALLALKNGAETFDPKSFVRTIAAFKQPQTRSLALPDGTSAEEIFIDPSSVVVEEIILEGNPAFRARIGEGSVLAIESGQDFILGTSEEILSFWLKKAEKTDTSICSRNSAILIRPQLFMNLMTATADFETQNVFADITQHFSQISLNVGQFSDSLRLCY